MLLLFLNVESSFDEELDGMLIFIVVELEILLLNRVCLMVKNVFVRK